MKTPAFNGANARSTFLNSELLNSMRQSVSPSIPNLQISMASASSAPGTNPLRSQLTFRGLEDACEAFRLNRSRLHCAVYACMDCGLRMSDHSGGAVSDAEITSYFAYTENQGAASRILDPSPDGAVGAVLVGTFSASLPDTIDKKHITAVVNCCDIEKLNLKHYQAWGAKVRALEAPPRSLSILRLGWADLPGQRLLPQLVDALRFIDAARRRGGNVLVHCAAGISRSGAVATAYVMAAEGVGFDAALSRVQLRRPVVQPNPGFVAQLREFERSALLRELRAEMGRGGALTPLTPAGDARELLERGAGLGRPAEGAEQELEDPAPAAGGGAAAGGTCLDADAEAALIAELC